MAGVAAGTVVGVLAVAGAVGGTFFYMRRKRNNEIEEEHRRNAAVNSFIGGGHSVGGSVTDARLDPIMAQRRMSDGSIADNEDYSRRILRVRCPPTAAPLRILTESPGHQRMMRIETFHPIYEGFRRRAVRRTLSLRIHGVLRVFLDKSSGSEYNPDGLEAFSFSYLARLGPCGHHSGPCVCLATDTSRPDPVRLLVRRPLMACP